MVEHPRGGRLVGHEHADAARPQGGQGDRAAPGAGRDAHGQRLRPELLERQARPCAVERRERDAAVEREEAPQDVADGAGVRERRQVGVAEVARRDVDAVGTQDAHAEDGGGGGRAAAERLAHRRDRASSALAQLGRADDRRARP